MGKTSQPLTIIVWQEWRLHPPIAALAAQGHHVFGWADQDQPHDVDLILHPAAHGWTDEMFDGPYLEVALKAARKRKKETK